MFVIPQKPRRQSSIVFIIEFPVISTKQEKKGSNVIKAWEIIYKISPFQHITTPSGFFERWNTNTVDTEMSMILKHRFSDWYIKPLPLHIFSFNIWIIFWLSAITRPKIVSLKLRRRFCSWRSLAATENGNWKTWKNALSHFSDFNPYLMKPRFRFL